MFSMLEDRDLQQLEAGFPNRHPDLEALAAFLHRLEVMEPQPAVRTEAGLSKAPEDFDRKTASLDTPALGSGSCVVPSSSSSCSSSCSSIESWSCTNTSQVENVL